MADSDEFRNELERRLGKKEYERIGAEGQQAPDDKGNYTAAEVKSEFRNRGDTKVDEGDDSMVNRYQNLVDGGTAFNARATSYLQNQGVNFPTASKEEKDPGKKEEDPGAGQGPETGSGGGGQNSKPNKEEKDKASTDAAFKARNYKDGYASRYTMKQAQQGGGTGIAGEFTGSGKDFVDYFANASEYNDNDKFIEKHRADSQDRIDKLDVINTANLRNDLNRSVQDSYDRANFQSFLNFGDYTNPNYKPPKFENDEVDEVERPDFSGLYKQMLDGLK